MLAMIIGALVCAALALAVLGLVAVPARRAGRDVLTPHGEEVVDRVRDRTGSTLGRTTDLISAGRRHDGDTTA